MKYCVYITIYYGNRLPMFYIGSTTVDKIEKNYRGSVSSKKYKQIWKQELKKHPELFKTIILTKHENKQEAINKEIYFQKQLKVLQKPTIYINRAIGKNFTHLGHKHTEETKEKIRQKNLNKTPWLGKKHSEETKEKLRYYALYERNLEHNLKIKEKRKFQIMKPMSDEQKQFVSQLHKGKILSEETKEKIRKARANQIITQETKEKIRKARLGKKHTEETKEKIRQKIIEYKKVDQSGKRFRTCCPSFRATF